MRRRSCKIAWSVTWIAFGLLPGGVPFAGAPSCRPAALVDGDEATADAVRRALVDRGIAAAGVEGCPVIRARVVQNGGMLAVSIEDAAGRKNERAVTRVDAAATVIATWAQGDLAEPLLVPRAPIERPSAGGDAKGPVAKQAVPVEADRPGDPFVFVTLSAESLFGGDGSVWMAPRLQSCVRAGPSCLGLMGRAAFDTGLSGDSDRLNTRRVELDAMLTVDFPISTRKFVISPGAGVGYGWLHNSRTISAVTENEEIDVDFSGLRADLHANAVIPISAALSALAGISFAVSPFAHTSAYMEETVKVAGEPRFLLGAGLGLRYEGP
ncbi:MAG: hypothetical protein HY897_05765 [Deltaproteobacteria bacterium]|nr:hypothetical protein [Deltaproteobacteria bacterium]